MLEVIGLDPAEERVYEAVLSRPAATLDSLRAGTGLDVRALFTALAGLERLGLITASGRDPARYVAVDPEVALDLLLLEKESSLKNARARAADLRERFRAAAGASGVGPGPGNPLQVVTGLGEVRRRLEQIRRGARACLRYLDQPPYLAEPVSVGRVERDLLTRGGAVRTIYARSALELPGRTATVDELVALGQDARVLPRLPTKLVLVDDRIAVLPLRADPATIDAVVIVRPCALLDALNELFEALWRTAPPVARPQSDLDGPTPADQRLLALLTAGLSDGVIGRELGLSQRTLQRRMQQLMRRLNCQTRFQLAVHASRRGWLTVDE